MLGRLRANRSSISRCDSGKGMHVQGRLRGKLSLYSPVAQCIALGAVILATDLAIPLGVAHGVLYTVIVLVALRLGARRDILIVAAICTLLILIGFLFSPSGGELWKVVFNRSLSVFVVWTTTLLSLGLFSRDELVRQFRTLFNLAPDAYYLHDLEGRFIDGNVAAEKLVGYKKEELVGKSFLDLKLFSDDEMKSARRRLNATARKGESGPDEYVLTRKDGSRIPIEINSVVIDYGDGEAILGIARDISARKQAEEMATRLGRVMDGSLHEFYFFDVRTLKFLQVNQGALSNLGYTHEEVRNLTPLDIQPENTLKSFKGLIDPLLARKSEKIEFLTVHERKDGTRYPVEVHLQLSTAGSSAVIVAFVLDITERQQAEKDRRESEEKFQHTQRLESLGVFAGGIAHDFNNLLMAILGFTDLALEDEESSDDIKSYLREIDGAGRRATELVKQILAFSRVENQQRKPIEFGLIVTESLKLIRAVLPSNIEIQQKIDTDCGMMLADPTQLHQVVMNLCTNAYQAMKDSGGILNVSLGIETLGVEEGSGNPDPETKRCLMLRIGDTGEGMDAETMGHIFEPFYTTKEVGEGTGLGLSTIHGIVSSYGGSIEVESEVGKGSVFTVLLPQASQPSEGTGQAAERDPVLPHGKERILYVDDEESLARLGQFGLQKLGYSVTFFTSSVDALAAFRENPGAFDLIVSDLTMPRMNGLELAGELHKIRPELPIIICTGFNENSLSEKALEAGVREIVNKPIEFYLLATKIRRVLSEKPVFSA